MDGVKVWVYSVPHSGTWFARQLIKNAGIPVDVAHFGDSPAPRDRVVVPLRAPLQVSKSWANRGRPHADLCGRMVAQMEYCNHHDVNFLPVDAMNRDAYLTILSMVLGKDLKTDWKPLHCRDGDKEPRPLPEGIMKWYGRFGY